MSEENQENFNTMAADQLSNYIIVKHHAYARNATEEILKNSMKMANEYGDSYPEIVEIASVFNELAAGLEEHMVGEEKYLFPYIEKLLKAKANGEKLPKPGFGSLENPLKHHYEDHDKASELMKKIYEVSKGYFVPPHADGLHARLYQKLKEFDTDLKQHIYLENEILFGKALALEKEVVEE